MQKEIKHMVSETKLGSMKRDVSHTSDYARILDEYNLVYSNIGYHLQIGIRNRTEGWLLYISIIKVQLEECLRKIIPLLINEGVSFKIPTNETTAGQFLDGIFGYEQIGKGICIFPHSDDHAQELAKQLISLTVAFRGPVIPTCFHIGGNVYTAHEYWENPVGNELSNRGSVEAKPTDKISWPFAELAAQIMYKPKKVLRKAYLPVQVITADARGRVLKAIYLKGLLHPDWCLVKEGIQNMLVDDFGRDITEKLLWQHALQTELEGKIPLPKIINCFQEEKSTYLVMEFIDGVSLDTTLVSLYQNHGWWGLSSSDRTRLKSYLLQIIDSIESLHQSGYVHRDITPANFLIDKKQQIWLIDMELAYCRNNNKPCPPYTLGTDGFMSPEQLEVQIPDEKEDIYGLGALMIMCFTGLPPTQFATVYPDILRDSLHFFIPEGIIVNLIVNCLSLDKQNRPVLNTIKTTIETSLNKDLIESKDKTAYPFIQQRADLKKIDSLIKEALEGLLNTMVMSPDHLWISKVVQEDSNIRNERMDRCYNNGWYEGMSGVMYLLAKANSVGIDVTVCKNAYRINWQFIQKNHLQNWQNIIPGWYQGAAGIALTIAAGIEAGLLEMNEENLGYLRKCFLMETSAIDVAAGVAGQGLSLMQCQKYLDKEHSLSLLKKYAEYLLECQQKDGSWKTLFNENTRKYISGTGFSSGVTGIIAFLLEYGYVYSNNTSLEAATKGLQWLIKKSRERSGSISWPFYIGTKQTDLWTKDGLSGIALVFMQAFEILKEPFYKKIAEKALNSFPSFPLNINLTQGHGLAGLGELYLEASRTLENQEWQRRADWIAQCFFHMRRPQANGACYWLVDINSNSTADLMTGTSGIIHFLIRFLKPEELGHPLLPNHFQCHSFNNR